MYCLSKIFLRIRHNLSTQSYGTKVANEMYGITILVPILY
jgi:hypothetical protein